MSSREQFNAWAKAEGLINESLGIRWVNEEFLNACWKAWQASRQAIEIALPVLEHQENQCEKCKGTGQMDSGGTQPWGESILVTCDCQLPTDTYRQIENDGREG